MCGEEAEPTSLHDAAELGGVVFVGIQDAPGLFDCASRVLAISARSVSSAPRTRLSGDSTGRRASCEGFK